VTIGDSVRRAGTGRQAAFHLSALAAGAFLVRVLGEPWDTGFKITFPDSFSYLEVAGRGPFRPFDERPVAYPTFLWLTVRSVHVAVVVQTMAYAAAFLALGAVALRTLQSRVAAIAAVVLIGSIAVHARFALWNQQILSESLGMTFATASLAAWWIFCSGPTPRRAVWAWLWTIAWMCVRDSHTVPILTVIVPVAVAAALLWRGIDPAVRRRLLGGAAVTVVLGGWIYVAQDSSNRNQYPFHNNIGVRILPDDEMTQWFVDGGMPLNDTLRGREGHRAGTTARCSCATRISRGTATGPTARARAASCPRSC